MKLRHWLNCALLIILPLSLPLMADQQIELTTVANSPDNRVSSDVLKEAYRRLGIDISILKLGASEALQRSNSGSADGEVQRIDGISRNFSNLIQVPIPINYIQGAVFSKNNALKLRGWYSLRTFKIGLVKGIIFAEKGTRGMQVQIAESYAELIEMLLNDQVDLIVVPYINGAVSIRQHPRGGQLHLNGILETYLLYHYLHKSHEKLVPAITSTLKTMLLDGSITTMRQKIVSDLTGDSSR
ncbi:MAG: transporter substrate-binding domain-containing protein [Gammaproteobacteria bacterium]|nr:transporter substrate-binding domain-containing protein [Gammaproteobacteria bacterium]